MTVTETAREYVRGRIEAQYTKMDIGEAGGSTDISQDNLFVSITSAASESLLSCTITTSTDNQIEYSATVSGSTFAGYIIREVGIMATDGNSMLSRIAIDPLGPLDNTKTYEIKVILEVE